MDVEGQSGITTRAAQPLREGAPGDSSLTESGQALVVRSNRIKPEVRQNELRKANSYGELALALVRCTANEDLTVAGMNTVGVDRIGKVMVK